MTLVGRVAVSVLAAIMAVLGIASSVATGRAYDYDAAGRVRHRAGRQGFGYESARRIAHHHAGRELDPADGAGGVDVLEPPQPCRKGSNGHRRRAR